MHPNSLDEAFRLIETMFYRRRVRFLEDHLERMRASAAHFGLPFEGDGIRRVLDGLLEDVDPSDTYKIRLTLGDEGILHAEKTRIFPEDRAPRKVCISPQRVDSVDVFIHHKTTRRRLYETEYARVLEEGYYEVLFLNENSRLTEASRNNIFVKLAGRIVTPPLHCGLLPGVYRKHLLRRCPAIVEEELTMEDLHEATTIYLCNAVRGLRKVEMDPSHEIYRSAQL